MILKHRLLFVFWIRWHRRFSCWSCISRTNRSHPTHNHCLPNPVSRRCRLTFQTRQGGEHHQKQQPHRFGHYKEWCLASSNTHFSGWLFISWTGQFMDTSYFTWLDLVTFYMVNMDRFNSMGNFFKYKLVRYIWLVGLLVSSLWKIFFWLIFQNIQTSYRLSAFETPASLHPPEFFSHFMSERVEDTLPCHGEWGLWCWSWCTFDDILWNKHKRSDPFPYCSSGLTQPRIANHLLSRTNLFWNSKVIQMLFSKVETSGWFGCS